MSSPQLSRPLKQIDVFQMAKEPEDPEASRGSENRELSTNPSGQRPPRPSSVRTADLVRSHIDQRTERLMFTRLYLFSIYSGLFNIGILYPIVQLIESPLTAFLGFSGLIYAHALWHINRGYRELKGNISSKQSQQDIAKIEQLLGEAQQIERSILAYYGDETSSPVSLIEWGQYNRRLDEIDQQLCALLGEAPYIKMLSNGAGWVFGLINFLQVSWATLASRPAPKPWLNIAGRNHAVEIARVNVLATTIKKLRPKKNFSGNETSP